MSCISRRQQNCISVHYFYAYIHVFLGGIRYQRRVTVCQSVYDMSEQILKAPKDMERSWRSSACAGAGAQLFAAN